MGCIGQLPPVLMFSIDDSHQALGAGEHFDDSGRIPSNHDVRRYVLRDDGTGANDGMIADGHIPQYDRIDTHKHIVAQPRNSFPWVVGIDPLLGAVV